ncbi:TonB-dependent receptor [Acidobacteria bacterium AB60]|nr:TonB-dependent receptor [Acidobacteria bacterium AB60]
MREGGRRPRGPAALLTALAVLVMLFSTNAWGQDNATITGTIADTSGALVTNAQVSLTNSATNQTRETTSNTAGAYRLANVGIGTYTLTVNAQGFQKYTKTGIVVNVAQTLEENVSLSVGNQTQTVTVAADALQVQTETSEVSNLISGQQVEQLATNGRNITSLAALGMGVSNNLPPFGGVNALTSANGISFNGTRTTHNIYMIDGGEQNDRGCGGCFMNLPSQDAIAEFQTLDSNYSPDYGVGSGGTILMVLKSGSRNYHGELYEFNRNTDYNANFYFNKANATPKPRPKFQLNEPGGNIGGPLWIPHVYNESKSRTFFFWNEEWRRLIQGSAPSPKNAILASNFPTAGADLNYTSPGAAPIVPCNPDANKNCQIDPAKQAIYTQDGLTPGAPFPKNADGTYRIPANLIDPNSVLLLNAGTFPKPNYNNGTQYIASIPQPTNVREDIVRIDHAINSKFQLMGHYLHDTLAQNYFPPLWGDSTYPTVGTAMNNPSYSAVIKLTQTYTPNLLNETAFLYSGNKITLTPVNGPGGTFTQPSGWSATSFFPVANNLMHRLPEIQLQNYQGGLTWSPSYYPWKNGYEGFDYRDDVSWTHGHHQFKFGFGWLHDYKNQQLQYNTNGIVTFNNSSFTKDPYVNFLLGEASSYSQLEFLAGKHWVNNNYSFYGNDNWHVSPRLTLNLGLRYDGLPHAYERYNKFANFVPADYNYSLGNPVLGNGTLDPATLSTFSQTGSEQFYLNGIREAGVNGFPRGNVHDHFDTLQPRVGFALDLAGNGKTVLRGGYGMFFERVQGNDVYNAALNPPFAYIPSANNVYFSNPNQSALTGAQTLNHFPSNLTNIKYNYPAPGTADWSFGLQRELAHSVIGVVQYVGSAGWDQNDDRQINTLPLGDITHRQGVATGGLNPNAYRIFPGFAAINQEENETNFNYHSLQAGVRMDNRHGLTTQVAYTWSHNISVVSNDLNGLSNPFNARYDRGSDTGFDRRHILNVSYIYALPFFKAPDSNTAGRLILGGWSVSGITTAESGTPVAITYGGPDVLGLTAGTNRPNLVSKVSYPKTVKAWFSTSSFGDPVAPWVGGPNQGFGNAGKDAVIGPGIFNWNLSLFKNIPLGTAEGPHIELRFESYNTFNHFDPQGLSTNNHASNFGQVTGEYGPRTLQLGGQFKF